MFVLVTGAGSQLGKCLKDLYEAAKTQRPQFADDWYFCDHSQLDITDKKQIEDVFDKCMPDVVVNCAAYTDVNGAESNFLECNRINCFGVQNLLEVCQRNQAFLITISTDYLYKFPEELTYEDMISKYGKHGLEVYARKEDDPLDPQSNYALSKMLMETIVKKCKGTMIIRTSWLYSPYGHNFMKTIVKKLKNNENLKVVDDQVGRPTNAYKLAEFILFGIVANRNYDMEADCEIYNYQDTGTPASWYDFAYEIKRIWNDEISPFRNEYSDSLLEMTTTKEANQIAKRPYYSVLDTSKANNIMRVWFWKYSLKELMTNIYLREEIWSKNKEKRES